MVLSQRFRVIVVIPMHPNGDYAGALKSKLVLHYELMTICKGSIVIVCADNNLRYSNVD